MAFVFDYTDPSNLGMFSKAGRFTSEKYIIFQKKDEIINNQRKFLKVTTLPQLKMDFEGKDLNKSFQEEVEKPKMRSSTKSEIQFPPFAKQLSRDEFYQTKKIKNPPPPFGFYNPKYNYVDKTSQTLFNWNMEKSKPQFRSTMTDFNHEEASRPIPDKVTKRLIGPIDFKLQAPRAGILSQGNSPHEERFNVKETPKNWSKIPRIITVDMNKSRGRDTQLLYKSLEFAPDYTPNFECNKRGLGSPGPKFDLRSPRSDMTYVSSCSSENFFNPTKSEKLVTKRTRDVVIGRYHPRDSDPSSPLPSFMQKSINSRMTIGTLSQKTLEINNYCDGKFQTVTSSFYTPKKSQEER